MACNVIRKSRFHTDVLIATCLGIALVTTISSAALAQPSPNNSDVQHGLDLQHFVLAVVYEADFSGPLKFVAEGQLFEDGRRTRMPGSGIDWVLEGRAAARVENGKLKLLNDGDHLVFWSTREFPADFLLEFEVTPYDPDTGLNIVFFSATARDGGSIFQLGQQMRGAVYKKYHSGDLNAYHVSYWATRDEGDARGSAHLRKSRGFHLVAVGDDFIAGQDRGPQRVRVLKIGGTIVVEVNGKIAIQWEDEGHSYGPVLRSGYIGLRQMVQTRECDYSSFKVWKVTRR